MNLKAEKDKTENITLNKINYKKLKIFGLLFFLIISIFWNINSIQSIINNFLSFSKKENQTQQNQKNNPEKVIILDKNKSKIINQENSEKNENFKTPVYVKNIPPNNIENKIRINSNETNSENNLGLINQKIYNDQDIIENINPIMGDNQKEIDKIENTDSQSYIAINSLTNKIILFMATIELQNAVYSGNPYTREYKIIKSLIGSDSSNIDLSTISKFQKNGLPNNSEIIDSFTKLIPDIKKYQVKEEGVTSWREIIINKLSTLITIKKITQISNTNEEIKITKVKNALNSSDLKKALSILEKELPVYNPRINTFINELKEINRVKSELEALMDLSREELFSLKNKNISR